MAIDQILNHRIVRTTIAIVIAVVILWLGGIIIDKLGGYFNFDLGVGSTGLHFHIGQVAK